MPPRALLESRLAIAARTAARLLRPPSFAPLAIGVVGSTALGRCSAASDLDLVAIVAGERQGPSVTTHDEDGIRVDVEWISRREALADTAGDGWAWELRKAARLGGALPLHDPDAIFAQLAARARAMRPDPERYAIEHDRIAATLAALDRTAPIDAARGEALRGALDALAMLVLLTTPRRYQKAKWTLDDLVDADAPALAEAILDAYGIRAATASVAAAALARATALIARILDQVGAPDAATLVAMGYAPDHAAASYVARALDDAADLAASDRFAEAAYVAGFAVRLAAALLPAPDGGGLRDALATAGLDADYLACFGDVAASPRTLAAARTAAAACAAWLARQSAPVPVPAA